MHKRTKLRCFLFCLLSLGVPSAPAASASGAATVTTAPLVPTAAAQSLRARGEARLIISDLVATLTIDAADIPFDQYTIRIGGVPKALILAMRNGNGTAGQVEFRDPLTAGFPLLNFDPRGKTIEIECGGVVFLSGVLGEAPAPGVPPPTAAPTPAPMRNVTAKFIPAQPALRIAGSLNFKSKGSKSILVISINNLSLTRSLLFANGAPIAEWTPRGRGSKLTFSNHPRRGELLLDFDPTGTAFEVQQNGVVVAHADAGGEPIGVMPRIGDDAARFVRASAEAAPADATGTVLLQRRASGERLLIEVEELSAGPYRVLVDGVDIGGFEVHLNPGNEVDPGPGAEGRVEFSTDHTPGSQPLTVDARGALIQIVQNRIVVLAARLPE